MSSITATATDTTTAKSKNFATILSSNSSIDKTLDFSDICQLDGNDSFLQNAINGSQLLTESISNQDEPQSIPIIYQSVHSTISNLTCTEPIYTSDNIKSENCNTSVYIDQVSVSENSNANNNYNSLSHIHQLDGNDSELSQSLDTNKSSLSETNNTQLGNNIPVIVNFRPPKVIKIYRHPTRKTIRRDNRGELSLNLPTLAVYNHRSIWSKINNFILEFEEMNMGVSFHSEVWERKENKKHQHKIEEMIELHNINYLSTPRPMQRGGGSAITVDNEKFLLKERKEDNPNNLENTTAIICNW